MDLEGTKVYIVIFEGDNFPVDIEVYSTPTEAIERAKEFGKQHAYYKKDFKEIKDKYSIYRATFDPEGGYVTVKERVINKRGNDEL